MDPAKLKVVELRAELSKRGLDSKGNKPVLVERLRQALEEERASGKAPPETSTKSEKESESEEDSSEPVKLPPRTPSRSSRHTSREPSTPVRTPTRRSSSRSSLNRQSPAKTILAESNETTSTLAPIVEEDKTSPKKDTILTSPKKDPLPASPQKDVTSDTTNKDAPPVCTLTPKKDAEPASESALSPQKIASPTTASVPAPSPKKEDAPVCPPTPKKETVPTTPSKEASADLKQENVVENETPKKDEKLEIVKEAEKHVIEKSQEITRITADEFYQKPDKTNTVSPVKSDVQSPAKSAADGQSSIKSPASSPVKTPTENLSKTTNESPVKSFVNAVKLNTPTASPDKSTAESPAKTSTTSPIKSVTDTSVEATCQNQSPSKPVTPQKANESPTKEESSDENIKNEDESMQTENIEKSEENAESMEVDQESDNKTEPDDQDTKEERSMDRKRKRSPSPIPEDAPRAPPIARPENEPNYDENAVLLSWYDSDLHLVINTINYISASPMQGEGFNYMWAGVRVSHGFFKGKVFYETRISSEFDNLAAQTAAGATNTSGALPVDEKIPSSLRLGWSVIGTTLQLGEDKWSFGYESTGKKATNNVFEEYGKTFAKDDVVGCYANFETDDGTVVLSYTVNGEDQGPAFIIKKEELEGKALFPHILSKNCTFTVNLGQEEPWSSNILENYVVVGKVDVNDRIAGPQRPKKREDCEVILLCGLPFSGKTSWALKHVAENPDKNYNVLGTHSLIEKMKVEGLPLKNTFKGRWDTVVEKCTRALTKLLESAPSRRRNYILDQQANVYGSAQRRKMRNFYGFHRKAIVLVPSDEEFKSRIAKCKEAADGEEIRESSILEVKANLNAPSVGESFEEVIWAELGEEEGKQLIESYNKEGKTAGYGQAQQQQQQPNKRSRFDNGQNNRNNRDNRDRRGPAAYNDRRGGGGSWRSGSGGWRDNRMRGGPMRHATNYGPPGAWRGRQDRRQDDRRQGNDRNRSRQHGWNSTGYQQNVWNQGSWQGQSQGSWSNQGNWGSGQQQQAWGGAAGAWKGYGQNQQQTYSQQQQQGNQNYGNGQNWNNWGSSQYYNQYWAGQQQPQSHTAGQTSSGGQAQTNSGASGQAVSKK